MPRLASMSRQRKDAQKRTGDRHKPSRHVRIHPGLAEAADLLAERNATTFPQEVNRALREYLQREGLWPPKE